MFFIAYALNGQVHVLAGVRMSENCWSLILQDKCYMEIFLSFLVVDFQARNLIITTVLYQAQHMVTIFFELSS